MVVILLLVPSSSSTSLTTPTYTTSISSTPTKYQLTSSSSPSKLQLPKSHHYGSNNFTHQSKFATPPNANQNYSREYVNHVTRIKISNDYPQTEGSSGEPEAVVKEGEFLLSIKFILALCPFEIFDWS
jgi:hypothetical protein